MKYSLFSLACAAFAHTALASPTPEAVVWSDCPDDIVDAVGFRASRRLDQETEFQIPTMDLNNTNPIKDINTPAGVNEKTGNLRRLRELLIKGDYELTCGTQQVPVDYDNLADQKIDIAVYRLRKREAAQRTQVFLLQGGPGGSGISILFLALPTIENDSATDIYIPDHRGTGRSNNIRCDRQQFELTLDGLEDKIEADEADACTDSISNVDEYNVENAARDLHQMVLATASDQDFAKTVIHGYSYGTMWAQRYMVVFPDAKAVDKVILEGVVAMEGFYFDEFYKGNEFAGDKLMAKCAKDAGCNALFPNGKLDLSSESGFNLCWIELENLAFGGSTVIDTQTFIQVLMYQALRYGIQRDAQNNEYDFRAMFLALVGRASRCDNGKGDVQAVTHMFMFLNGGLGLGAGSGSGSGSSDLESIKDDTVEMMSTVTYNNIKYSELWSPNPLSTSAYRLATQDVVFGVTADYANDLQLSQEWNVYTPNPTYFSVHPTDVSYDVLVVNGEIDGQTPLSSAKTAFDSMSVATGYVKQFAGMYDEGHSATDGPCGVKLVNEFTNAAQGVKASPDCAIMDETEYDDPVQEMSFNNMPSKYQNYLSASNNIFTGAYDANMCTSSSSDTCTSNAVKFCDSCITAKGVENGVLHCTDLYDYAKCLERHSCPTDMCETLAQTISTCSTSFCTVNTEQLGSLIIGLIVGGVVLCCCCCCGIFFLISKNGKKNNPTKATTAAVFQQSAAPVANTTGGSVQYVADSNTYVVDASDVKVEPAGPNAAIPDL